MSQITKHPFFSDIKNHRGFKLKILSLNLM